MARIKNRALDSVGVITEVHPVEVSTAGFTDALNVRFDQGAVITRRADEPVLQPNPDGNPVLSLIESEALWYFSTADKLWRFEPTGDVVDLSREIDDPDNPGTPIKDPYNLTTYWETTVISNVIIKSNFENVPQFKGSGTDLVMFQDLPGWGIEGVDNDPTNPDNQHIWNTRVIRTFGSFLIALGMSEVRSDGLPSGEYNQRVRWSAAAQPGQPPASWNGATLETNAGWNDLSGATGRIIDGANYQDSFIIFTEQEVFKMDLVGGVDIFRFTKLFDDGGMLTRNCACEFQGQQFVVGTNDIYVHDTSSKRSVADGKIKQRLFDEISSTDTTNIRVHHKEINSEIWVLYSSASIGEAEFPLDRAAVWNYDRDNWTFFTLPNLSAIAEGMRPGTQFDAGIRWDDLDSGLEWDTVKIPWRGREVGFGNLGTVAGDTSGAFYLVDSSTTGDHPERYVERVGLDISSEIDDYTTLEGLFPVLATTDGAAMKVTITGTHDQNTFPDFDSQEAESYVYTFPEDRKIDCRQTYRFISYRIDFTDDAPYELSALDLEARQGGSR